MSNFALVAGTGAGTTQTPPYGGVSIQFYHLLTTPLDRALPKLLEKAYSGGYRTLLVADSDEHVEQLNQLLWTYDLGSFLPHGSAEDGNTGQQPILLSTRQDSDNNANILFVINGMTPDEPERYERIIDMFDGTNETAVQNARNRWANYKKSGFELTYLKQNASGGWDKN